jgi:hypothetical protein
MPNLTYLKPTNNSPVKIVNCSLEDNRTNTELIIYIYKPHCYRTNIIHYKQPHKTSVTASMYSKRQKILTLCHSQITSQYVRDCRVDQLVGIKTKR